MSLRIRVLAAVFMVGCAPLIRSEGLSFTEAVDRASRDTPAVEADTIRVDAAQQAARAAGKLPDPKLLLGIDNLPVEGPDQYSFSRDSMIMQRIGFMQDFPNRGKRSAEVALAQGQVDLAQSELRLTRLNAVEETASAWIVRRTLEQQLAKLDELDAENRLLDGAVRSRIASGQGMPVEAVAVRQEAAALAARRDALEARREQVIAQLRRWIGQAADEPLLGDAPELSVDRAALLRNLSRHPELTAFEARAAVLDSQIAEAKASRHPDWAVEMAYQRRGSAFGNMVSLQVSIDLPIFPGSRQIPRINGKLAERRALDSAREADLREHQQMLEADLIELERLRKAVERQRQIVLPLAEEKVALLQSAWRANIASLADLIGARRERIEAETTLLELEGTRQAGLASLHFRYEHTGEH